MTCEYLVCDCLESKVWCVSVEVIGPKVTRLGAICDLMSTRIFFTMFF